MNTPDFIIKTVKLIKSNSPEILTALGVSGVLSTSYLVGKASFKAKAEIDYCAAENKPVKEKVKIVWKYYIPAGVSGALTIACIVGSSRAGDKRTTAAVAAYSLTERAFSEYKEKVVEQIGKGQEQKIRDEIVQDQVDKKPLGKQIIVSGTGNVLCCELFTHRYFRSDMETLRRAQNDINAKVVNDLYVTLDEFYNLIGLPTTSNSGNIGWNSDRLMDLEFSTVLSEEGEPCLAFDYNYAKPL